MSDRTEVDRAIEKTVRELPGILPAVQVRLLGAAPSRDLIAKRSPIGEPDDATRSNQVHRDEENGTAFTTLGAVDPAYDPEMLALIFEHSNSLRQNIDAYATNIDGFGHRFDPLFDVDSPDIDQRIGDAIYTDRQRTLDAGLEGQDAAYPTADEITKKRAEIERAMRLEKTKLHHFFEFCSPDSSFVSLRRRTRQDQETTGNAYWEVLRNRGGQVVQFAYMASFTLRLLPLDRHPVKVSHKLRVSDLSFDEVEVFTRLRRYVQVVEARTCFFKEFGDPRLISSLTGAIYSDVESMQKQEGLHVRPATELIHFRIHSPRSPYGVPRWIGNLLSVIGSRQAEEVNFNYFENKSVPPLAILVSGGRLTSDSAKKIEEYIESNLKGKRNFHKILLIEAESAESGNKSTDAGAAKMKIDIKPLTGAQHNDALFQSYDERNIDKVGQAFRLPRMLRGDVRDFNRATADAALTFAEMQVFEPERQEFDWLVNRKVLAALGIRFWKFVSLAPVMRDPAAMSAVIKDLSNAGVLTPEEGRELAGDVFNRVFRHITASWVKQPIQLTLASIPLEEEKPRALLAPGSPEGDNFGREGGEDAPDAPPPEGKEARLAKRSRVSAARALMKIRDALETQEATSFRAEILRLASNG